MRRVLVAIALMVALIWALPALAIEANGSSPMLYGSAVGSGDNVIQFVWLTESRPMYPSGFTMFTNDASEFWFRRAFADGVRDTFDIGVPAGRSILIPSPGGTAVGDSTYIWIFVGGHTDSLYAMPWYR